MSYIIKRLENTDKNQLIAFEKLIRKTEAEIWNDKFCEETYKTKIEQVDLEGNNNIIICAFKDDKIIGRCDLIVYESLMDFKKTGYIDWLYVEKSDRCSGVGRQLIDSSIEYLKKNDVESCFLFTANNEEAKSFYSKLQSMSLKLKEIAHQDL